MKLIRKIGFVFLLLFLFSSLLRNILDYKNKYQFYLDYKNDYEKEKKRNIELKTEVVKKKSLTEVEKTIRDKLNLLQPNEIAIILPTPSPSLISVTPTPAPNWQQWWQLFFK